MGLVPAKCSECGANIEIDSTKEAGICSHCGTAFVTQKAISNYSTIINNNIKADIVNIAGDNYANYKKRVMQFITEGAFESAQEYMNKAFDINIDDLECWRLQFELNTTVFLRQLDLLNKMPRNDRKFNRILTETFKRLKDIYVVYTAGIMTRFSKDDRHDICKNYFDTFFLGGPNIPLMALQHCVFCNNITENDFYEIQNGFAQMLRDSGYPQAETIAFLYSQVENLDMENILPVDDMLKSCGIELADEEKELINIIYYVKMNHYEYRLRFCKRYKKYVIETMTSRDDCYVLSEGGQDFVCGNFLIYHLRLSGRYYLPKIYYLKTENKVIINKKIVAFENFGVSIRYRKKFLSNIVRLHSLCKQNGVEVEVQGKPKFTTNFE